MVKEKQELIRQIHWKAFLAEETVQSRKEHGSPGSERKYSWSQKDRDREGCRGAGGGWREAGARPPPVRHTKKKF